jgi:TolA-binding protein
MYVLLLLLILVSGCSSLPFMGETKPAEVTVEKESANKSGQPQAQTKTDQGFSAQPTQSSDTEKPKKEKGILATISGTFSGQDETSKEQENLQQARILARLNELENVVNRQVQKIRILEKAVTLGVIPEELKSGTAGVAESFSEYSGEEVLANSTKEVPSKSNNSKNSQKMKDEFKKELATATSLFSKGEIGKSFIIFQRIDQEYSEDIKQGETLFWMGRCWFSLNEFQTAKQYLRDMIRSSPASTKVAQAKLFIARADLKLGMMEGALEGLRDVIRDHQDSPSSNEARKLLAELKDTL